MKLWIVRIERAAYVMAETESDALDQQDEIERMEDYPVVSAEPAGNRTIPGWDDGCLVYHSGFEDVTLGAARRQCTPAQPDREVGE